MTQIFSTGSGYLNRPYRTVLIDGDNRPGSYPVSINPQDAASDTALQSSKPYNDELIIETPVVYSKATVSINRMVRLDDSITLTNANGNTSTFVFKSSPSQFVLGPSLYAVDISGVLAVRSSGGTDAGIRAGQKTRSNIAQRIIAAVNAATGSLITASPVLFMGSLSNQVTLTQAIPGASGNTVNTTTSPSAFLTVTNFTGGRNNTVRYPYAIPTSENSFSSSSLISRVIKGQRTGTLDVPTSGRAGLLSAPSNGHPWAGISPFNEANSQQSFGIHTGGSVSYGTQTDPDSRFLTRGSISGSLNEPLSSKDKIVIDLEPVVETELAHRGVYPNHTMAYFGFGTKKWEPIGLGSGTYGPLPAPTTITQFLDTQYLGFSTARNIAHGFSSLQDVEIYDDQLKSSFTNTKRVFTETGWLSAIDTFGFPLHPKYHATSSQQLSVDQLIEHPFLVEKIVYEFSASMPNVAATLAANNYTGNGFAFFILNQRKANPDPGQESSYTSFNVKQTITPFVDYNTPLGGGINGPGGNYWNLNYDNGGIPRTMKLSNEGPQVYVDTVRDLVTFARVGVTWPTYQNEINSLFEQGFATPADFMDLAIEAPVSGTFNPTGSYTVAADVRAPSQITALAQYEIQFPGASPNGISNIYSSRLSSTRNALDIPTGRSTSEFTGPDITHVFNKNTSPTFGVRTDCSPSPYLLLPGDKLIFGVQCGTQKQISGGVFAGTDDSSILQMLPGAGKLTLYGSYLRDNKPIHDIYKDQLNSDAAHEALPAGPWVLDRFENEPTMVYSSSMREEHVTGTMVTRRSDGTLSVTDVGDLSIGGVRAVSARVSDGTVGARWSFFRNNRLFDEEEQYYDSMQPNPLDVLFGDSNVKAYSELYSPQERVPLMLPGETFSIPILPNVSAAFNQYSNRTFFSNYLFGETYKNISRVKRINSRVLTGKLVPTFTYSGDVVTFGQSKLDGGIAFITGTMSGQNSNFIRKGGLYKHGTLVFGSPYAIARIYYPLTSRNDTNPTRSEYNVAETLATDAQSDVNYWLSRFMGCFGDGFLRMVQMTDIYNAPESGEDDAYRWILTGLNYRGTKHGLINPTPLFSSAVFSGTRYGQFRDMLEQRQNAVFSRADDTLNKSEQPVSVVFINRSAAPGTNNVTTGSATNSSNISPDATSEHPYDDALSDFGVIWDRSTPLPETL